MQNSFVIWGLIGSYAVFSFGPYLVWPSRWNIVGHLSFGLFVAQYLVPLLWTDPFGYVRPSTVRLYTDIMMVGAVSYLLALPSGFRSRRFSLTGLKILTMPADSYRRLFHRRVIMVTFLSTVGLLVSYLIMGFVPMFAADPLQAKYFQGSYHDSYLRASFIFRPSFFSLSTYLSLGIVVAISERKLRYYLLIIASIAAMAGYLQRAELGVALISGIGILVAAKRGKIVFTGYLLLVVVFITLGTMGNYLLNVYFALNTGSFDSQAALSERLAQGAPDVREGLRFFDMFEDREAFTGGRQFIAGLLPLQSMMPISFQRYAPGIWAQSVLLGIDDVKTARDLGGGGVRIALPISGYAGLGWFGVILMSSLAGFLTGYFARFAQSHVGGSLEQSAIVIVMYQAIFSFASDPAAIVWYNVFSALLLVWLIYPVKPLIFFPVASVPISDLD